MDGEGLPVADEKKELAKDLASEIIPGFVSAMKASKDGDSAVAVALIANDLRHISDDVGTLKKVVFEQHEPVVIWARGLMDSYRKIATVVIASGLITVIGLLIQMYYLLQKAK